MFDIEIVENTLKKKSKKITLGSYISNSYRNKLGEIADYYPLVTEDSKILFYYTSPQRLFSTALLNSETFLKIIFFSICLLVFFIIIHKDITSPILDAQKLIHRIIKDKTIKFSTDRTDELGSLFNLIDRLLEDVHSKEQELQSHNIRLQKLSTTDGLTNIANRRSFDMYMNQLLISNSRSGDVSLLVCDVDYFKRFNDYYGHAAGDNTLKQIAQCLLHNLHSNTDFVARYGGEEFVIVLNDTSQHQGICVGNNLLKAIQNLNITHVLSDISDVVTISIGLHTFEKSAYTKYESLFNKADKALYAAKEQGRNQLITSSQLKDLST
ncbi:GGDEF domain-containing protein [Pseudoalteromonas sp. C2R02]|uniref:GGDEF domain-containing protein n=1 Tax=Pseudoalteromonas sp. C2R02 TaxID=2841565 RepID=UPI0025B1BDE2|nr:GGDEF domain-containing protein [Pseudoalteromonas sp. C2R02]